MEENEAAPNESEPKARNTEKPIARASQSERKKPEQNLSSTPDPFLLDKIYPEPHRVFFSTEKLSPKSHSAIVSLDTNALLLPYYLGKGDISDLANVYSQFAKEGRLFLPDRVAREFIKNRDRKLAEMSQAIDDRISRMNAWEAKVTPLLLDGFPERDELAKSGEELAIATKKYLEMLRHLSVHMRDWRGNDPVTTLYASLFTKERMVGPGASEEKMLNELNYGIQNQVPPGYKDSNKNDRGIGDVVIWMSLLNLGKITGKDLIFVTGEQKADWFVRSGGHPVYPRPELVEAYRNASNGRSLRLSSLHDILREMAAPDALVTDVMVAETTANSAIQAASTIGVNALASTKHSTAPDPGRAFDAFENSDRNDDIHHSSNTVEPSEAELLLELKSLENDLQRVQSAISQITQDEFNTSLSLPWNRAAHGLRGQAASLIKRIFEIQKKLRDARS